MFLPVQASVHKLPFDASPSKASPLHLRMLDLSYMLRLYHHFITTTYWQTWHLVVDNGTFMLEVLKIV